MTTLAALVNTNAFANLAVRDIAKARAFYAGVLGLSEIAGGDENLVSFRTGDSRLIVYRSDYAGTNQATAATWVVGERVDAIVGALRDKGVRFEHYDNMPDTRLEGDVHVGCGMRVAWFKDPDGNILNVVSG